MRYGTMGRRSNFAELVSGELGPALIAVLFTDDGRGGAAEVLLASCDLPLKILVAFLNEVVQEEHDLRQAGPSRANEGGAR
jgi:hypothetical protein